MQFQPVHQRTRIHVVQFGGLVLAAAALLVQPQLNGELHEIIEAVGFFLVLACVAGRLWTILYVGAKKNRELVTSGPYSLTRNPLYVFSTIGAAGIGLIHGSIAVAVGLALLAAAIFLITAAREAAHLRATFGSAYEAYARRTPMFWPKLSLYRDQREVEFSPKALKHTFLDCLYFLAAFPLIEFIESLQQGGALPTLARLF
jgi:protein-S-isoprenylcysteine O-methyltransferase Ste14